MKKMKPLNVVKDLKRDFKLQKKAFNCNENCKIQKWSELILTKESAGYFNFSNF